MAVLHGRTPYADSCDRLRIALSILDGLRTRIAALPSTQTAVKVDAAALSERAAASSSAAPAASSAAPGFVAAAAFDGPREGYAFKTGSRGTGYYRPGADAAAADVSHARRPANRHARQEAPTPAQQEVSTLQQPQADGAAARDTARDFASALPSCSGRPCARADPLSADPLTRAFRCCSLSAGGSSSAVGRIRRAAAQPRAGAGAGNGGELPAHAPALIRGSPRGVA